MPDVIDKLQEIQTQEMDNLLARAHEAVKEGPKIYSGTCCVCGEDHPRLVNDMCAPCRDEELIFIKRTGGKDYG